MTALALFALGGVAAGPLSAQLAGAAWRVRRPRLALASWWSLGALLITCVTLAGLALAAPRGQATTWNSIIALGANLGRTRTLVGLTVVGAIGLSISVDVSVGALVTVLVTATRLARQRRRHRAVLDLVGRRSHEGTTILDAPVPVAYFVPGRGGRIVLSSQLMSELDDEGVAAVVAHESSHHRHHHAALALPFLTLEKYVAWVPFARLGASQVRDLLEYAADDAAARRRGAPALVRALRLMVREPATIPACALGIGGAALSERIRRLNEPATDASAWPTLAMLAATWVAAGLVLLV